MGELSWCAIVKDSHRRRPFHTLDVNCEIAAKDVGVMLAPLDGRALLWDYVPWEQMSKQRRGVMWSLQLARTLNRQRPEASGGRS